ncbi:MAG TPA: flagellar filament capping protein FliD [Bryobacteraceae bacterium]|jgi:flagellar hook-associated protein 2|nr:flagellar filament capping protein FliD [Bryobacteraceae bacterium]
MGSVTNSLTSTANTLTNTPVTSSNSTTSSNTNTTGIFTGTSAYSNDFQNMISRAVAIASMPINLLTSQQTALTNQSKELTTLDTKFTALQTAIQGLSTAMGGASFQYTSSAPTAVTATLGDGAAEGVYSIKVDNPGVTATSLSTAAWNQPALTSGQTATYGLVVGNQVYSVTTSDNSVQGVAAAINAAYGSKVNAVAVNVGNSWRISLQSTTLGPENLNLIQIPSGNNPTSLQTQNATGYAVSQTTSTWASTGGPYNLIVNGTNYAFSPTTSSAQDVATAINTTAAANSLAVNAQVVDLGTGSNHDYRIQVEGTAAGAMTLDISNGGSASLQTQQGAATSQSGVTWNAAADAVGTESQYTLAIGSSNYNFVATDNSAQTVAATINSQFGSMVNATVVDLGSGSTHDYRIALQDKTGTSPTLDIQKTTANSFQAPQTTGQLAAYELDGAAQATSTSSSIQVANGVTLNLLGTNSGNPVMVTVTQSSGALSTALSSFTDAYNACVDEINSQHGQSAGPLQGQSILSTLSQSLNSLSLYGSSTGSIATLHDLGMDLGTDGHLTYNALTFMGADFSSSIGVNAFLGSATSGGFLKAATDALTNLEDPTSGLIKTSEADLQTQITNIGTQISTKQTQVDQLQTQLTSQMAAADAAIASMEQQYSYLSSMFSAQQTADQMYK